MLETLEALLVEAAAITKPKTLRDFLDEIRAEQTALEDEDDFGT